MLEKTNATILEQNKALMARLERLEAMAHGIKPEDITPHRPLAIKKAPLLKGAKWLCVRCTPIGLPSQFGLKSPRQDLWRDACACVTK